MSSSPAVVSIPNGALLLSPSTEAWDRGGKFESYMQIESLREYLLISSTSARAESFLRHTDGTRIYADATGLASVMSLRSLRIDLPLAKVYAGVTLAAPSDDAAGPPASDSGN